MLDTLEDIIGEYIKRASKYFVPRLGCVKDLNDPDKFGRILCHIPAFGLESNDVGVWAYPINNNNISTPKVNDYVLIIWLDGKPEFPYYITIASHMKNQLPQNYDANKNTHIIFESPENKIRIKYDESADEMTIGKEEFKKAARENDTTIADGTTDAAYEAWRIIFNAWGLTVAPPLPSPMPASRVGKINSGSDQVKIGDK